MFIYRKIPTVASKLNDVLKPSVCERENSRKMKSHFQQLHYECQVQGINVNC